MRPGAGFRPEGVAGGVPPHGAGPAHWSPPPPFPFPPRFQAPTETPPSPPSLRAGLRWAWTRFSSNAGVIVGAAVTWIAILIGLFHATIGVLLLAYIIAISAAHEHRGAQFAVYLVLAMIMLLVAALPTSCLVNGFIQIADGHQARFGDFFRVRALKPILAIFFVVGLVSAVVQMTFTYWLGLPWLSGAVSILVGLFALWPVYAAAELRLSTRAAASTGLTLCTAHLGPTIVVYSMSLLLTAVGLVAFIVGTLVTAPLTGLLSLYYFRSLTRRPAVVDAPLPARAR